MVDRHDLRLRPIACGSTPALWMLLPSLLIRLLPFGADCISLAKMALIWRHILNTAVTVLCVVPVHKSIHPGPHLWQIAKSA